MHLFGGVDLTVRPDYVSRGDHRGELGEAVRAVQAALRAPDAGPVVAAEYRGRPLIGHVLPVTRRGREMQGGSSAIRWRDVVCQLGGNGRVSRTTDPSGYSADYVYDGRGRLVRAECRGPGGQSLVGERTDDGSTWTHATARGDEITMKYDRSGHLARIEVNGDTWARKL